MIMAKETIHRYTLKTEKDGWLGEVILTDNKEFYSLTDWGNFNFSWSTPMEIREFILSIDVDYFGRKMYQGVAYQCSNKGMRGCCERFAAKILPALKEAIKQELKEEEV